MKAIKAILITLLVLVLIVAAAFLGTYFYVRSTYGIDLFRTADQLKTLNERVDESTLCPNAYGDGDFVDMKDTVNAKLGGLIVYQDGKGYNGYYVDFQALAGKTLTGNVSLTEKQVGAIAQTVLFAQTGGKLKLGDKEVSVSIVQVDFSDCSGNGSADFNVVAKLDLSPFKANMDGFPYKYVKKYIPDTLYVSSTVRVDKTDKNGFEYAVSHKSLTLNNLSSDDTADLFKTLDTILKIGSIEDLNVQIGTIATNALIGNKDNVGFAYSMRAIGAITFDFVAAEADLFIVR